MTTKTKLIAWNGETYTGLGELFDTIREQFEDLDMEEALRLAIYAWNSNAIANGMDLTDVLAEEQESYAGAYQSEAEFTEELITETCGLDVPNYVVIDWQATWDRGIGYDYFTYDVVTIDGEFVKYFWRAY